MQKALTVRCTPNFPGSKSLRHLVLIPNSSPPRVDSSHSCSENPSIWVLTIQWQAGPNVINNGLFLIDNTYWAFPIYNNSLHVKILPGYWSTWITGVRWHSSANDRAKIAAIDKVNKPSFSSNDLLRGGKLDINKQIFDCCEQCSKLFLHPWNHPLVWQL
jgi:hypothetical protein